MSEHHIKQKGLGKPVLRSMDLYEGREVSQVTQMLKEISFFGRLLGVA